MTARLVRVVLGGLLLPATAIAQPADDGYCDFVEGTAAATAAPLFAPDIFGQVGRIEQPTFAELPDDDPSNFRALGGARYSLTNLLAGRAVKSRARAECRRHRALVQLRGAPTARALAARIKVYDDAQAEATRLLDQVNADLEARRATVPEATAVRLRVEELRASAARSRTALAGLAQTDARPLAEVVSSYRLADAAVESDEARLRTLAAYDLNLRVGVSSFIDGSNTQTDVFAVLAFRVNLGALWVGGHNDRAAAGRRRHLSSSGEVVGEDATMAQLRATHDAESKRAADVGALVSHLGQQLDALGKLEGDQNKRFRETIWFDWVAAKAELAHVQAYVDALGELIAAQAR